MIISEFFSFLLICLVVELTPGPNMAYLVMISSVYGRKAGLSLVAGVTTGLFIVGLFAALSASALILKDPAFYYSLRWAGVFYLLWLAWDSWRIPLLPTNIRKHFDQRFFWRGFITNILNPKAWMFYIAVFPTFINDTSPFLMQALIMTIVYVIVATTVHSTLALLSESGGRYLQGKKTMKVMRYVFTGLLLALALWFAWSTQLMP